MQYIVSCLTFVNKKGNYYMIKKNKNLCMNLLY